MEKYRSHLIIAKIHTSGFPKKDLFDSVKEFLSKCEPYEEVRKGEHENYFWLFGDLDFLYESKDKIIYGKLGKRKESEQRTK